MKVREVEIFDVKLGNGWNPAIIRINTDEGVSGIGEIALAYGVGSAAGLGVWPLYRGTNPGRRDRVPPPPS